MGAAEVNPLGENVRARREAAHMSLDVLYARMTHLLPESMWGSTEMIRRLERGVLERPNPFWLAAIAKALGCGIRDLSVEAADDLITLVELAGEVNSPINSPDGQTTVAGRKARPSPSR